MKPFNLEKALAGAEVITRDGRKVTQLTLFDVVAENPLRGVIENADGMKWSTSWPVNGRWAISDNEHDLFMAPSLSDTDRTITEENCNEKLTEMMMELVERLGNFPQCQIDERAWRHLLVYEPSNECPPKPIQRLSEGEILNCMAETITLDDLAFARAIEDALEKKNK